MRAASGNSGATPGQGSKIGSMTYSYGTPEQTYGFFRPGETMSDLTWDSIQKAYEKMKLSQSYDSFVQPKSTMPSLGRHQFFAGRLPTPKETHLSIGSLSGLAVFADPMMVERRQHSRSPTRAKRRAAKGHRQHFATFPRTDFLLNEREGTVFCHPAMLGTLIEALERRSRP